MIEREDRPIPQLNCFELRMYQSLLNQFFMLYLGLTTTQFIILGVPVSAYIIILCKSKTPLSITYSAIPPPVIQTLYNNRKVSDKGIDFQRDYIQGTNWVHQRLPCIQTVGFGPSTQSDEVTRSECVLPDFFVSGFCCVRFLNGLF